jgi:hypothetical protein
VIRIATEEAWAPPKLLALYRDLLKEKPQSWDPGFHSLWGFFLGRTPRATQLVERIQDLGARRDPLERLRHRAQVAHAVIDDRDPQLERAFG